MDSVIGSPGLPSHVVLEGFVGSAIRVDDSGTLRLDEVTVARTEGALETFCMYFSGDVIGGQGLHRLTMPGHSPTDVFLVTVAPGVHEAIVTRAAP